MGWWVRRQLLTFYMSMSLGRITWVFPVCCMCVCVRVCLCPFGWLGESHRTRPNVRWWEGTVVLAGVLKEAEEEAARRSNLAVAGSWWWISAYLLLDARPKLPSSSRYLAAVPSLLFLSIWQRWLCSWSLDEEAMQLSNCAKKMAMFHSMLSCEQDMLTS